MPVILRRSRWTTKPKIRNPELDFAHPLSAGQVGAWIPGLASASATLRDLSGNGNHGTLFASWTPPSTALSGEVEARGG